MGSNRKERTNSDIQYAMSKLLSEVKDPRISGRMISVTRVEAAGDLRYCKVWLSVFNLDNEKEFRKGLKSASGWIRKELGNSLNLRNTPELVFEIDHSIEYGAHISKLIEELHISDKDGAVGEDYIGENAALTNEEN